MFKNVASQKLIVFAFDSTTNLPKTGDAANLTAYVSKDYGTVTVLGDTSATEMDATNAKGYYLFDLTQAETNGDTLLFSGKSSTANIVLRGAPDTVFTFPTTGFLAPATSGRTLVVDASGLADANAVKVGPSGSGTAQTARDIGASVLLSSGTGTGQLDFTSGVVKSNLVQILATALTETSGQIAAGFKQFFNISSPTSTMNLITGVTTVTTTTTATTATNLTNAPTSGDFTATMKTSLNAATPAVTVSDKTGFSLTSAYDPAKTAAQAGDAMALTSGERTTLTGVIWAALTSGLSTIGSIGKRLADDIDAAISSITPPTVGAIADAVWDEALSGHTTPGSAGKALTDAGSAGDPWATALPGSYSAGQAGKIVGDSLDATITSRLAPTVAARTLDVSATGEAGVDWGNVGSPTTTLNLSGTTIKTATDVEADTEDIQTRLPAALMSGRMDSSVGAYQSGLTPLQPTVASRTLDVTATGAAGVDWGNVENPTTAVNLSATNIDTDQVVASVAGAVGSVTGNVGGSVASVTAGVTVTTNNDKAGYSLATAPPTAVQNADALLGRNIAGGSNGGRTVTTAFQPLRNKVDTVTVPGFAVVYGEDDATESWRAALTTSASADPVVTMDPTT